MAGLFGFLDFTKEGPGIKKDGPKKKALFVLTAIRKLNWNSNVTVTIVNKIKWL